MKSSGATRPRQPGDGQGRRVGAQQGVRFDDVLDLGEDLLLELLALEDRLDHQVAAGQVGRLLGRLDAAQHLGGGVLGHPALLDERAEQALGMRLAALGRLDRGVLEHDLHTGARTRVGDAGTHHPGTQDPDLARRGRAARRPAATRRR